MSERPESKRPKPLSAEMWMMYCLTGVAVVGVIDYLSGFEMSFFAFYLVPVTIGVWYVGRRFGILISALSVVVSAAGDLKAGARYSSTLVPIWNAILSLGFYLVVVWILSKLRGLHHELEERVRQRTAALNKEMHDRMRLEEEILAISEREQQRIGRDLHDSLCQHLTGVALAGEVLREKLKAKSLPETGAIDHIVAMIEEAIELTRTLARGLHPFHLEDGGFTDALRELAATITEGFNTPCVFECDKPVTLREREVATHLYRIAQEAATNAVKHSGASEIVMRLERDGEQLTLTVSDDGIGLGPEMTEGMGLRTMSYRASVIGGTLEVKRLPTVGTRVICRLPENCLAAESHDTKDKSLVGG